MIFKVMDSQNQNGNVSTVFSLETNESMVVVVKQSEFRRHSHDQSHLNVTIIDLGAGARLSEGALARVTVSLQHFLYGTEESNSNAYDIEIYFYYDRNFLQFESMDSDQRGDLAIPPTSNTSEIGLIRFRTEALTLYNTQIVSLNFSMKQLKGIMKGDKCATAVFLDLKYMNNSRKFQGAPVKGPTKKAEFKCEVKQEKEMRKTSKFSMVLDNINGDFFFCAPKKQYLKRMSPNCYMQPYNSKAWKGIGGIVNILGVDTTQKILYGVDHTGRVILRGQHPYDQFYQTDDHIWATSESQVGTKKAIKVQKTDDLPSTPTEAMTLSFNAIELWVGTKSGIMKKNAGGLWKKVVQF